MNKTKKIMRKRVGAMALALAMSCWLPGMALAEENSDSVQAEGTKVVAAEQQSNQEQGQASEQKSAAKAGNNQAVAGTATQNGNVPIAEVEVKADKEKAKLTIGQQEDAEGVNNYVVTKSSTGSKSDIKNKDLPQTISVVGQKIMEEQRCTTFDEALANVAGISSYMRPNPDYFPATNLLSIRGFGTETGVSLASVNGLWDPVATMSSWVGNLERIEVLKGPGGVLYGNGSPGGLINYITKKPLPYYKFRVGTDFLSWGGKSQDIDMSMPLTKDKKWLSRTIIQNADYHSFLRGVTNKRLDGSVMVQGQPRDDTTYTFEVQFHDHKLPTRTGGLPYTAWKYGLAPYDGNYYNPDAKKHYVSRSISAKVDHKFNDDWSIQSGIRYTDSSISSFFQGGTSFKLSTMTVSQSWTKYRQNCNVVSWDTTVNGHFQALGLKNNLVTGFTWGQFKYDYPYYINGIKALPSVSLYDPVFATTLSDGGTNGGMAGSRYQSLRMGSYINDMIELSPKLKLSTGISYTLNKTSGDGGQKQGGKSWRLGATYETSPGITLFTGYSTSYLPLGYTKTEDGRIIHFEPETGNQVEGGVKVDLSNRASVTLSAYRINRQKLVYQISEDPEEYAQIGQTRSKGWELESTYVIQPGWNVLAAFSQCNARVLKDEKYVTGALIPGVPYHSFKLWSTYELQQGRMKGLGFGGGVTYVGKRAASYTAGFLPAYTIINGVVYYKTGDWRYSLNVNNLTNRKYWPVGGSSAVYSGTPRSFIFRIEKSFY